VTFDADKWDGKDKLPTLYSCTATGAVNTWEVWLDSGGIVVVRWGQKGGALQTATFQCTGKNIGRSNETSAFEQARLEAISKWKKQLKKKYYERLEDANKPHLRPMLAAKFVDHKSKVKFPVHVQPKFDGVRCLAYRLYVDEPVALYSRGGDPYDVEHIRLILDGFLEAGTMLDGEIYVHGMSLQQIISLVKRPQEESKQLNYHVYDCVNLELQGTESWEERHRHLEEWFEVNAPPATIVEVSSFLANREAHVAMLHDDFVKDGYEGAIVRTFTGTYRIGYRSQDLLKVKSFDDAEYVIAGWTVGKGKFANVPIFKCKLKNGKTFDVAPRGTDEVRARLLKAADSMIGKPYTVRHFGFSDTGVPRFPVGIGIREKGT